MFHKNTFGDTKASEVLAELLSMSPSKLSTSVSRFTHQAFQLFNDVSANVNLSLRKKVLAWAYSDRQQALSLRIWPQTIKSHVSNILTARYRCHVREMNIH
jgi:hypothetical protein